MGGADAWSHLPNGCPPETARPMTGMFHRLTNGTADDWTSLEVQLGAEARPAGVTPCSWAAISVFADVADVMRVRRRSKKYASHRVSQFPVDPGMGVLHHDSTRTSHHDWWPTQLQVFPPKNLTDVEEQDD